MSKIYHFLDEGEAFSEFSGGAISRWAANVLRNGNETIICPSFDASWGFPAERLFRLPSWDRCSQVHPLLYRSPWEIQRRIYLRILRPLFEKLNRGDILYIHNRPETADVLAKIAEERGSPHGAAYAQFASASAKPQALTTTLKHVPIVFCSEFLRKEATSAYPNHFQQTHVVYNGADDDKFSAGRQETESPCRRLFLPGASYPTRERTLFKRGPWVSCNAGASQTTCTIVGGSAFGNSRRTRYVKSLEKTRPSNTELIGYRTGHELAALLREADIFLLSLYLERPLSHEPLWRRWHRDYL